MSVFLDRKFLGALAVVIVAIAGVLGINLNEGQLNETFVRIVELVGVIMAAGGSMAMTNRAMKKD